MKNLIVIYGLDGSGKTTLIRNFLDLNSDYKYFHFIPTKANIQNSSIEIKNSKFVRKDFKLDKSNILKIILSYLRLTKTLLLLLLNSHKLNKDKFIVDRYIYGYYSQPIPLKYFGNLNVVKYFFKFVPKPDLNIFLDTSPQLCFKRKPELPLQELEKERLLWIDFTRYINGVVIDGDMPEHEILKKLQELI